MLWCTEMQNATYGEKGKHCCKAPGIKTPKIYHRKCPPQMKMIHISKCKPSGGGTDEDEDADEDDLYH